ncbi:MAG: CehA/McbA family metallohydrolase [Candidatus Bathyarchaeota archaeon]|nr:CehA/McbA family metallohydrolase [Candidatus Bathyarchaeota archaeon]
MDRLTLRLDLHVHTRCSGDSVNSITGINQMCRELSLDGYAVCDHDSVDALAEAGASSEGLVVVPGLEVTARGAHIICLDPSEAIPSRLSIVETVERIHDQGATAILAHPYAIPRSFVRFNEAEAAGFDAVEVANSAQLPFNVVMGWNRGLAEKLRLPQTGGSDSHIPETFGRSYTVVDAASREPGDVIKAIREGRTSAVGAGTGLGERLSKLWRVLHKG